MICGIEFVDKPLGIFQTIKLVAALCHIEMVQSFLTFPATGYPEVEDKNM